ncbi:MAG: hypothetical protein DRR04_10470 [Gammaproteobacteria bacterium]|nr:MAG: hypothetical protein DRR04_10470 [Gammaproteobacteria bacterium]
MRLTSFIAIVTLALLGCAGAPTYNPTVYAFNINEELLAESDVKTVVIPHVNLGIGSRSYLAKEEKRIDGYVDRYLREKGYKVLPQREFKQHWNTAVRAFGNPSDPTTGKINMKTFAQIMTSVRDQMKESGLDAFVFTDLVELQVSFSNGLKHLARWDGVSRKPSLQGPGDGVSGDFDWYKQAAVASLQISIYDIDLQRLFTSRGGIDATDAIDTRSSSGRYIRRRNILENEAHLREGIELSFHPFIEMEAWPGNP